MCSSIAATAMIAIATHNMSFVKHRNGYMEKKANAQSHLQDARTIPQ